MTSDIKTFQIVLMACLYLTRLPQAWANSKTAFGNALRESHPSEDLSELLPLREG